MKRISCLGLLAGCLLVAGVASAQTSAKSLTQLLKSSFTAPKKFSTLNTLSTSQMQSLRNRYDAIEEARRALYQNPGWVVSKDFAATAAHLKMLGLPMPKHPAVNASLKDKELYRQQLNKILQHESRVLGTILAKKPRPDIPAHLLKWDAAKMLQSQTVSRQMWEQILKGKNSSFAWGTPNWDQVRVTPVKLSENPGDPNYISQEVMGKLTEQPEKSITAVFDFILQEKTLSPQQKQFFMMLIDDAASVLSYNFVQLYMYVFNEFPAVSYDAGALPKANDYLRSYAYTVQRRLLDKLDKTGTWAENDFEFFVETSVYLPAKKAQAVLSAATYLEPQAALWLLNNPLKDETSQKILNQLTWVRNHQQTIWPNGDMSKKSSVGSYFFGAKSKRIRSLQARMDVLNTRLQKLMNAQYQLNHMKEVVDKQAKQTRDASHDVPEYVTAWSFVSARKARLQKLINQTQSEIQNIREELALNWGK